MYRLVEGDKVLDAVAETLEADLGVVEIVRDGLLLVHPSAVALLELEGEVPAIKQNKSHM